MSARPTAAIAGSVLPTPTTSDKNGPGLHGDGAPDLRTVASLLPTPEDHSADDGILRLYQEVRDLLPTPTASDSNGPGIHGTGAMDLRTTVSLLPTPTTSDNCGTRNDFTEASPHPTLREVAQLIGSAPTSPQSTAGPTPSDAPHPTHSPTDDSTRASSSS